MDKDWKDALEKVLKGEQIDGVVCHVDKTTTQADYDKLNPNSLETNCRDCDTYYVMTWEEKDTPPTKLICPECGSNNHGCVGSPAGAAHLAMFDPNMP